MSIRQVQHIWVTYSKNVVTFDTKPSYEAKNLSLIKECWLAKCPLNRCSIFGDIFEGCNQLTKGL